VRNVLVSALPYIRRRGFPAVEAQDLTQQFFLRVLEGRYFDRADRDKGRFRAFLLSCLKYFLSDERDRCYAQKRGGGMALLPFEISNGEALYQREPFHDETRNESSSGVGRARS
jgi:RNA polymerase sigma-70 factor (ECF subfamily)